MSRKPRNDSLVSNSSTDRDTSLNLSNLSTTPTFSNVALFQPNNPRDDMVKSEQTSPSLEDAQSPLRIQNDSENYTASQSIAAYNQPMLLSTFSFSRMASSLMQFGSEADSIKLPASLDVPRNTILSSGAIPQPSTVAYNPRVQSFGWNNMAHGPRVVSSNPAGLSEKRSERGGQRHSQRPPISPNPNTGFVQSQSYQTPDMNSSRLIGRTRRADSLRAKEEHDSVDTTSVDSPRENSSLYSASYENLPMSTGLLTLSIHEALTFDGVELALHPDVFHLKQDGEQQQPLQSHNNPRRLCPGDLVEIRVWSLRPDVKVKSTSNTKSAMKSNAISNTSNYHSRNPSLITLSSTSILSPGVIPVTKSTNYHSHNTSLATLPSASILSPGIAVQGDLKGNGTYGNMSLMNTPQSSVAPGESSVNIITSATLPPPLPSIIGGNDSSPVARGTGSLHYPSPGGRATPDLRGEYLMQNSSQMERNTPSTSNLSSAATTSFVGLTLPLESPVPAPSHQKNKLSFSTIESDSVQGHSRDSSLVTSSSAIHSRESSLLSPNPSLLTMGSGTGGRTPSPGDETIIAHPASTASLPPHPLAALSQQQNHPTSSKKVNSSATLQRPRLPPSNDVNLSLVGESGTDDVSKKQLDLISEEINPESFRVATASLDETHNPSSSLLKLSEMDTLRTDEGEENADTIDEIQKTHFVRVSFVVPISETSLTSIKSGARTQVSLLRRVADLYKVTAFCPVTVTKVNKREERRVRQSNTADFITMTMKDQFVSRRDMYSFQKRFLNDWVFEGKRLSFDGIRTNVKVIRHGNHAIKSGIITEDTKITFRSRSARIIWLVQISSEMWDFASPYEVGTNTNANEPVCHIYFDKFVSFCRRLFVQWKKLDLSHNLTVIYFSRTYIRYQKNNTDDFLSSGSSPKCESTVHVDADGRYYEDHYKIVIENETRADWESLIPVMKREFVSYPKGVKWSLSSGTERIPSTASQGNVLESINITLNLLHLHYIDRDLHRTGNSIVVITSGNGVFEIDKDLASITKQRMMDNGIGSDMLSLSLPPLHIAPFFLYKEKGSSNEEEFQGFDDWKVFFEIPHWMNLSFLCYDYDDEPMLYKQNQSTESANAKSKEEDDSILWQAFNGFLTRTTNDSFNPPKPFISSDIFGRDFQNILQACRPRNRGEHGAGLPLSLSVLIKKIGSDDDPQKSNKLNTLQEKASAHQVSRKYELLNEPKQTSPHRVMRHLSREKCLEWGAINFENIVPKGVNDDTGSQSSHSSGFASCGSHTFLLQPNGIGHLQSSISVDTMEREDLAINWGSDKAAINKFMSDYDEKVFSHSSRKKERGLIHGLPGKCASPAITSHRTGGIEAALEHFDNPKNEKDAMITHLAGVAKTVTIKDNSIIIPEGSLAVSPLDSLVMHSFDGRRAPIRPNLMRLVLPEAPGNLGSLGNRRKSLSVLHDSLRSTTDHGGSLRTSRNHMSKILSIHSNKHLNRGERSQHHSKLQRRKHWVLNPFRQHDEDEVLAKRTHNRRRWSHVFPLGEEEFKRHAGPNWKSLCQPAILPMTIDFHPSAKELQDKERFRIKQYSVTLPPMNETHYKSHRELLDELVAQRIIQDYQIVPRAIISSNRDPSDKSLEQTLSMGHKIQQLSYNSSQDSVDVVQYYANFAENETPQIYRYSLWSTLMQDYVNVAQTFTKYTSPYKWNEVDMLISGDAFAHILEGMRYPRISFVIIPDRFSNFDEEKDYVNKFQKLVEYFVKLQQKDIADKTHIEVHMTDNSAPKGSKNDKRFIVDLRKRIVEKYEWMEMVHDSNFDTRRTFRITLQWLVAVSAKIEQQAQILHRRCTQYGLKLISVPHFSSLPYCFLNPFVVPLTIPIRSNDVVDRLENALTNQFDFVYDGSHMSDPNELDNLDGFDFSVNKWSIKKRKKFVPANQYLHRSGTLFGRILRDQKESAILIMYLNTRYVSGDDELRSTARRAFRDIEGFIDNGGKSATANI